mmetsp:Transcript_104770/g.317857  ORF Transcript_104770/g.317857 Transcript_104770/m.317857 type:complete len:263 (-) Transcript_104770:120-908(-)
MQNMGFGPRFVILCTSGSPQCVPYLTSPSAQASSQGLSENFTKRVLMLFRKKYSESTLCECVSVVSPGGNSTRKMRTVSFANTRLCRGSSWISSTGFRSAASTYSAAKSAAMEAAEPSRTMPRESARLASMSLWNMRSFSMTAGSGLYVTLPSLLGSATTPFRASWSSRHVAGMQGMFMARSLEPASAASGNCAKCRRLRTRERKPQTACGMSGATLITASCPFSGSRMTAEKAAGRPELTSGRGITVGSRAVRPSRKPRRE